MANGNTRMLHARVPKALIAEMDKFAARHGLFRSQFITQAAEEHLRRDRDARAVQLSYGALRQEDQGNWATAESAARWLEGVRHGDKDVASWRT